MSKKDRKKSDVNCSFAVLAWFLMWAIYGVVVNIDMGVTFYSLFFIQLFVISILAWRLSKNSDKF